MSGFWVYGLMTDSKLLQQQKKSGIMPELNSEKLKIGDDVFIPYITEDKLQKRIKELGEEIS